MKTKLASKEKPWLKYYSKSLVESELPACSIYEYLYERNSKYSYRTALSYYGKKISYDEFFRNIDIIAESFRNKGVKEGDIITVSMPTIPETFYIFYALSKIGAISNMIDPRKSPEEMEEYINSVNSKLLVVIDAAYKKIKKVRENTSLTDIIVVSASESLPNKIKIAYNLTNKKMINKKEMKDIILWNSFYNTGKERIKYLTLDEVKPIKYVPNRCVAIVYTGGTTGLSKGVSLSNDNINCGAYQCSLSGLDFQRQHKWLDIMPPFIAYGVGNGVHLPLICGMEVILIPKFDSKKFDKLLIKYKPNHVTGVPTHYDSVIKSKGLSKMKLDFLYSVIVGGDKLEESLENKINEFLEQHDCNYHVTKGYGLSEAMAAVCVTGKTEYNLIGSVGIPFTHTNMGTFDKNSKELPLNEVGEICVTGPNTMIGYYNNKKETDKVIKKHDDGLNWVHTGDLGYIDEDGRVFIVGRIKEMIIRHDGFKVYPILIENAILSHPSVNLCKVVGIKDLSFSQGELPKAFIELKNIKGNNNDQIIKEIKEICKDKLAEYLQPTEIIIKDKLPTTSIGKIDYKKLKEEQ